MSQDPNEDHNAINDEYRRLYDEFVAALRDRNAGRDNGSWFSEDDLVDIFDYAGDIGKDYVRAEALMWGARMYPDSEILRERRGVFYSDLLTDEDVAQFTSDNGGAHTFLSALLDLRSQALKGEAARTELQKLIRQYNNLDDEESIQFVNLAADTDNLDWLMQNLDALKRRVRYRDTLLYEIGMEALQQQKTEYALRIFGEMVEMSPYNITFWCALARTQYTAGMLEVARDSVDMALAIAPDNIEAVHIHARLVSTAALPGFCDELKQLNLRYPDDLEIAEAYVDAIYRTSGGKAPAEPFVVAELKRLLDAFPQSSDITANYIALAPIETTAKLLDDMWLNSYSPTRLKEWREWSAFFFANRALEGALAVVSAIVRNADSKTDIRADLDTKATLCLLTKRWTQIIEIFNLHLTIGSPISPQILIALIYAQMHLHQYSKALGTANFIQTTPHSNLIQSGADTYNPLSRAITTIGARFFAERFKTDFFTRNPQKADKFDPLNLLGPL